eukprot:1186363-Prorocentrum_minimum.AAC.2
MASFPSHHRSCPKHTPSPPLQRPPRQRASGDPLCTDPPSLHSPPLFAPWEYAQRPPAIGARSLRRRRAKLVPPRVELPVAAPVPRGKSSRAG